MQRQVAGCTPGHPSPLRCLAAVPPASRADARDDVGSSVDNSTGEGVPYLLWGQRQGGRGHRGLVAGGAVRPLSVKHWGLGGVPMMFVVNEGESPPGSPPAVLRGRWVFGIFGVHDLGATG